ncbi:MAG: hypothetical protein V1702_02230 [Candidatus Woesearchaeota archaeon]
MKIKTQMLKRIVAILLLISFTSVIAFADEQSDVPEANESHSVNIDLSARTLLTRGASSDTYSGDTPNERLMQLYMRKVNMQDLKGIYRPYEDVTSLQTDADGMTLEWNDKRVRIEFYILDQSDNELNFKDMNSAEKNELAMNTQVKKLRGAYYYNHSITNVKSLQPNKLGYKIITENVTCYQRNLSLVCGDQLIDFSQAVKAQNLTVEVKNDDVQFSGEDLSYIDPTVTLEDDELSHHGEAEWEEEFEDGYSFRDEDDDDRFWVGYGLSGGRRYRSYLAFVTANDINPSWDITDVDLYWYDQQEEGGSYDTIYYYQVVETDANAWTPNTWQGARDVYDAIGARTLYGSDTSPDENAWNVAHLGTTAAAQLESDRDNEYWFMVGLTGICCSTESEVQFEGKGSALGLEPYLIVTYTVSDQTAPTTSASATSPPGGSSYTFGSTATNNVQVTLSCSDTGGDPPNPSGCAFTRYCLDMSNSCTPSSTYSSAVTISTEGTSYIRYMSQDNNGNAESTNSRTVVIDLPAIENPALYVNGSQVWSHAGEFDGTETTDDFANELNTALSACNADADGFCNVPLTLHSATSGTINMSKISVYFNTTSFNWNTSNLTSGSHYRVRVKAYDGGLNSSYDESDGDFSIGTLTLNILSLNYVFNYSLGLFEFIIENNGTLNVNNVTWKFNLGDGTIINSTYNTSLTAGEKMIVYAYYNYSIGGDYIVNATAYALADNVTATKTSAITTNTLFVTGLNQIYSNLSQKVFEFVVNNTGDNITVNWSINFGDGTTANSVLNTSLSSGSSLFVYLQKNYSGQGHYTVNATAQGSGSTASANIPIQVEYLGVSNFSNISSNGSVRVFEATVKNYLGSNLSNVSWSLNTGNGVVSSVIPSVLLPQERAFVFVEYNYTSAGSFVANFSAVNGSLFDWELLNVTVT